MTPVVELFSIHPQIEFCVTVDGVIDACLVSVGVGRLTGGVCVAVEGLVEGCLASVRVGMATAGVEEMLQPSTTRVSREMILLIELFRDILASISVWRQRG